MSIPSKTIVFIAPFPSNKNIGEGMMQRVKHIDSQFKGYNRLYLNIRLVRAFSKSIVKGENLEVYTLNLFTHFNLILRLLRSADLLYLHSVYNALPSLPFLRLIPRKTKVVLDVHGVVPEELAFAGEIKKSNLYAWVEHHAFARVDVFLHVTNSMKEYYLQKYPFLAQREHVVYPIQPDFKPDIIQEQAEKIKKELGISPTNVVFVYSGGAQKWQNLVQMFSLIKDLSNPNYRFIILSGDLQAVQQIGLEQGCISANIIYKSVQPSQLGYYYQLADYGFVLRDNHILNRVASPTKLIEYLYYGIVPVVQLQEIGDFATMGYECLPYTALHNQLPHQKSEKNMAIATKLLESPAPLAQMLLY